MFDWKIKLINSNFYDSPNYKGHISTISTEFKSEGSTNNSIEVGQGNLKLLYSADEGKLTQYVNNRNLVSFQFHHQYISFSKNTFHDQS